MSLFEELCDELIECENLQKIKDLLNTNEINLNQISDRGGETPLIIVITGHGLFLEVMELLLENGADPNFPDRDGWLPLEHSIDSSVDAEDHSGIEINTKEIELLLKYGADIHKTGASGETPYEYSQGNNMQAQKVFEEFMKK